MLNIRADDIFHAQFNECCAEFCCQEPVKRVAAYLASSGMMMKEGQ